MAFLMPDYTMSFSAAYCWLPPIGTVVQHSTRNPQIPPLALVEKYWQKYLLKGLSKPKMALLEQQGKPVVCIFFNSVFLTYTAREY
jgi:hypothetical protein